MNTFEIIDYLNKFKNFDGVYPKNMIPNFLNNHHGLVINTDPSSEPGEHWVSVYKYPNGQAVYFDSFGMPPLHNEIIKFLDLVSPKGWFYNTITFQSVYQDTCGMYCVYFLSCMLRHSDFNIFKSIFRAKPHLNDIFAKLVYKIEGTSISDNASNQ